MGAPSTYAIRLSVCLSVCTMPVARQRCILGLWLPQNTNRNPTLLVESTGHRGRRIVRNGNEAVAGLASEASIY